MFETLLKQAMSDAGMNLTALSAATGIGKSSISQYLSGKNEPTDKRKVIIAQALGLAPDFFKTSEVRMDFRPGKFTPEQAAKLMGKGKEFVRQGFSSLLRSFPLNNFDVMPNPPIGLKTLEGFMGSNIKETDVPFDIDRPLTKAEIEQTVFYCTHDVEETIKVFIQRKSQFDAMLTLVKQFKLPISDIGKTEAGITAKILECEMTKRDDEFDFIIEDYQQIKKYTQVMDWFRAQQGNHDYYSNKLEVMIANVPHKFGAGGIHGARPKYKFMPGQGRQCWHIDVTSYYPSYLIAHDRITRSAKHPERYSWAYFHQIELKRQGRKPERLPYKKMLNALSGAMKDKYNPAYDPCMNNTMVVNCQISALMLIEMLEVIPGFELIQSNTDGLIVSIPDTDEAFNQMDDICYEWETRCSNDVPAKLVEQVKEILIDLDLPELAQ